MSANSFGDFFKVSTFGESHGEAMGALIEGCPSGVIFDQALLVQDLQKRRPGQSQYVSGRNEPDYPIVLSGVFEGKTLGTPICIVVKNKDQQSKDYSEIKDNPRTGHADDLWKSKYSHNDYRGGGRSSGRETLARVIGGSIAKMMLAPILPELEVQTFCQQVGPHSISAIDLKNLMGNSNLSLEIMNSPVRIPNEEVAQKVMTLLGDAKEKGLSYGGTSQTFIHGLPQGLGQPVFKKLKSQLAAAMLSIGATSGFQLGTGESSADQEGSLFHQSNGAQYAGIRGGLSTGEPIYFQTEFKPTSSVLDVAKKGRHDPCIVPRACSVVDAMTYIVLADAVLTRRLDNI